MNLTCFIKENEDKELRSEILKLYVDGDETIVATIYFGKKYLSYQIEKNKIEIIENEIEKPFYYPLELKEEKTFYIDVFEHYIGEWEKINYVYKEIEKFLGIDHEKKFDVLVEENNIKFKICKELNFKNNFIIKNKKIIIDDKFVFFENENGCENFYDVMKIENAREVKDPRLERINENFKEKAVCILKNHSKIKLKLIFS